MKETVIYRFYLTYDRIDEWHNGLIVELQWRKIIQVCTKYLHVKK